MSGDIINAEIERQLKTHVERIVRPIRASEKDKLKMRDELYAHAFDAFEHERLYGADKIAAADFAIKRLGEPEATRRELQATVGWSSRYNYHNDRLMRRAAGESLLRHAAKIGLLMGVGLLLFQVLLFAILEFDEFWRWTIKGQLLVRLGLSVAGAFGVGMFFGMIFSEAGWRLAERRYSQRGDWLRAGLIMAGAIGSLCAVGWGFTFAMSSDYAASLRVLTHWLTLGAIAAPAWLVLPWLDVRERRPLAEWLELDLAE